MYEILWSLNFVEKKSIIFFFRILNLQLIFLSEHSRDGQI